MEMCTLYNSVTFNVVLENSGFYLYSLLTHAVRWVTLFPNKDNANIVDSNPHITFPLAVYVTHTPSTTTTSIVGSCVLSRLCRFQEAKDNVRLYFTDTRAARPRQHFSHARDSIAVSAQ